MAGKWTKIVGLSGVGAAATIGGVHAKGSGQGKDNPTPILLRTLTKPVVSNHKNAYKDDPYNPLVCVTVVTFPNGTNAGLINAIKIENGGLGDNVKDNTDGCLIINGTTVKKVSGNTEYTGGEFKFLWSLKNNQQNKGVSIEITAQSVHGDKFKWSGAVYYMAKQGNAGYMKKKVSVDKTIDKNNFPTFKLPGYTSDTFIQQMKEGSKTGCSVNNKTQDKDSNSCGPVSGLSKKGDFQGRWDWKGNDSESETVGDGITNLDDWWKAICGESKGNISDVIKDIKGKGTQTSS